MTTPTPDIEALALGDIAAAAGLTGYSWDLRADHIIWLGNWRKLFGEDSVLPPHNAASYAARIAPDDQPKVLMETTATFTRDYRLHQPDGKQLWVRERGVTDYENGRAIRQRALLQPIDAPQPETKPRATTETDALTGCPDRARMLTQIERLLRGPRDARRQSGFLAISIDKMAFVNDAIGTEAADALLCGVAERLKLLIPRRAILARIGGDMFGVLLPGMQRDIPTLVTDIRHSFRDAAVPTPVTPLFATVSIGSVVLADLDTPETTAAEILIHAEQALREARKNGRNQYNAYPGPRASSGENRAILELGNRVKHAMKTDQLRLAYQPVLDATSGQVLFYEALARLTGVDGKQVAPTLFIAAVEQLGLALEFDRHVLGLALRELENNTKLKLAINISGFTASQSSWPDYVRNALNSRPHVAQRLIVEITETAAITDVNETRRFIEALTALGGQVALDDFGAGFTSIRHLRTLSLAIMKLDRDLLDHLIENPEQQHVVRLMIRMAHGLNIKTVAEGIESEAVADWLRNENVDMLQGYYFGEPTFTRPWHTDGAPPPHEPAALTA